MAVGNEDALEFEFCTSNGRDFFKLRDLAALMNFGVTWNAEERTIIVNSYTDYVPE